MIRTLVTIGLLGLLVAGSTTVAGQPRELGKVGWLRDFDEAVAKAKEAERPILVLFQEVPG